MKDRKLRLRELLEKIADSPDDYQKAMNKVLDKRDVIADPMRAMIKITELAMSVQIKGFSNVNEAKAVIHGMATLCLDVIMNEIADRKKDGLLGKFKDGLMFDLIPGKGIVIEQKNDEGEVMKEKISLGDMDKERTLN